MINLSDAELSGHISTGITVVDFYADWCSPCKALAILLEKISKEMPDVKFAKLNVDDNMESTETYSVSALPTVVIFRDGKPKEKIIGLLSEVKLREAIARTVI